MPYHNLHYRDYVRFVYQQMPIIKTKSFLVKAIVTLPRIFLESLVDALGGIVFLLTLVILITQMSQGRDIIVTFFEPQGLYGLSRMCLTTFTIILYSICTWIVPAFMFEWRDRLNKGKVKSLYKTHLFFAHRLIALLPFWAFMYCVQQDGKWHWHWLLAGFAMLEMALLAWLTNPSRPPKKLVRKIVIATALVIVLVCGWHIYRRHGEEYNGTKAYYSIGLYVLSILAYLFYNWCDRVMIARNRFPKAHSTIFTAQPLNTGIYFTTSALTWIPFILCIWVIDLRSVVPESLILLVFSGYVLLIEMVHYFALLGTRLRYWLNVGMTALVLFLFLSSNQYTYLYLKYRNDKNHQPVKDLDSMESYYNAWKEKVALNKYNSAHPYDIILVSGEGGGSRAGYWLMQGLLEMDAAAKGQLKNHIFSMSTVSGSSVGAGAMLSYWTFLNENHLQPDTQWNSLPRRIFRYNFVGGNLSGVLVTDWFKSLIPLDFTSNRNWEQQKEEAECVQQALLEIQHHDAEAKVRFYNTAAKLKADSMILNRDFMSFYYSDGHPAAHHINADLPLCFINTTRSSDSRRGIFSPVVLPPDDFKDALDMNRFIYDSIFTANDSTYHGQKRRISLGAACNTSELFPVFSAATLIDNLGYFLDGGYHENSGLQTTLEIYDKLNKLLKADVDNHSIKDSSYRIWIVYFKNAPYEKIYYPGPAPHPNPALQPVNAVLNEPFSGNSSYFEEAASGRLGKNFIRFQLAYNKLLDSNNRQLRPPGMDTAIRDEILADIINKKPSTAKDTTINFPLARWLSYFIIDEMRMYSHWQLDSTCRADTAFRNFLLDP